MRSRFLCAVLIFCLPNLALAELIVFKRYSDDFVLPSSHIDHTVWVLDAPNVILDPINMEGKDIVEKEAQADFEEKVRSEMDKELMRALVMISFIAKAKANKYGITVVPSAIQVDRDGTVVRKLEGHFEIQRYLGELDDK